MRRLFIFFVILTVLFVGAAYALVNGGLLPKLTNGQPGVFAMKYRQAKLVPPLSVEVDDVEFQIQDHGFRIRILAERATGDFKPMDMARLRVSFTNITASGVSVFVRMPEPSEGTPETRLPPVDTMAPPTDPVPGPLFAVELADLKDVNVREIWVDGFRYQGDINVSGGFALVPMDTLTIHPTALTIDGGVVTMPNGLDVKFEPSKLAVEVRPLPLGVPLEQKFFENIDANVQLGFHAPNLNLFNELLLNEVPEVRLLYGAGAVSMNVGIDAGVVTDGSELTISPRNMGVRVPYFDIIGRASLDMKTADGKAHATLQLPAFELDSREKDTKVATGKGFTMRAVTSSVDLTKVRNVDVSLKLDDVHATDLKFLDRFIPAGSGIILVGGAGHVGVDATLSTRTRQAKGQLNLTAQNLELRNRSALVVGTADVTAILDSFDMRSNRMDLRGSSVKLTNVTVKTREKNYSNVSMSVVAAQALWAPETETPWKAKVAVGVSNLQPLVGIVSANMQVPGIVVGLLDIPDVAASAEVVVMKKEVRLMPLAMTARDLRVDAQVVLRELPNQQMEPHGAAFVKLGPLTAGMAMDGGITTPVIFGAPEWYKKQVAAGIQ